MTTAGSFDAPIEIFGGLVTDLSPADLPHGVSPDCQNVVYSNSGVETRPGLQTLFGPLAGIATGLKPNSYAHSTTLFGREYLAISDGRTGKTTPKPSWTERISTAKLTNQRFLLTLRPISNIMLTAK